MNFYRLFTDEGRRKKYAYGVLMGEYVGENINCSLCGRKWNREPLLEEQTKLNIALTNDYYPDFLYVLYNILIPERVKEIFEFGNITGYYLQSVNIISRDNISKLDRQELVDNGIKIKQIPIEPPIYYRLVVKEGAELHPKSNLKLKCKCESCGYEEYEEIEDFDYLEYIKKESWNGKDLFYLKENDAAIYCVERFANIYKKYKLTGLELDQIEGI